MRGRSVVVSLIGRPNVGKSSLYNRLMRRNHKAITFDMPGVTRDRHYGMTNLNGDYDLDPVPAILVDTGGFYPEGVEQTGNESEDEKRSNMFFNIMTDHAQMAIDESDLVLVVVDVREGVLPFDRTIVEFVRSRKKPFWILINKYDTDKQMGDEAEFYEFGVEESDMMLVSAEHGLGLDTLKKQLHQYAHDFSMKASDQSYLQKGVAPREEVVARLALIGAPNAGKSTLLNYLIGAQRALVSDIPGTTVDPIEGFFDLYFGRESKLLEIKKGAHSDSILLKQYDEFRRNNPDVYQSIMEAYNFNEKISEQEEIIDLDEEDVADGTDLEKLEQQLFDDEMNETGIETGDENEEGSYWRSIHLVDTAGIRKQKSIKGFVESQSVYRSLRCISESDVVLYMVDATKGVGHQDRRLLDIALEKGKSVIICMNKMDLMKEKLKSSEDRKNWLQDLRDHLPWLAFCDIVPISAKHGKAIKRLKKVIKKSIITRHKVIPTGELNRAVFELVERNPVIVKKSGGKRLKVKYTSHIKSDPPTFLFFTNRSKGVPENYQRYLKNGLRQYFELDNAPVHLMFRTGKDLSKRGKLNETEKKILEK